MSATLQHPGHIHNAELNRDPTGTTQIRDRFEAEAFRRFRRLKGLIRTTVGYENDAFGLRVNSGLKSNRDVQVNAEPVDVFDFPTDPQKEAAFMEWLQRAIDDEIISPVGSFGVRNGQHWTAKYVRASYVKAVQDAGRQLRAEGFDIADQDVETIFNLPVHQSSIRRIYQRAFENLDGITDDMAVAIREELAQGFVEGVNPNEMARRLNGRVDAIGITRARALARTETINAYSLGTLDRFERAGVGNVTIRAEWSVSGDERTCATCWALEGRVWTVTQARNDTITLTEDDVAPNLPPNRSASSFIGEFPVRPPSHVSCRCSLLPVVS